MLGLWLFDVSHNVDSIIECVLAVVDEYSLTDKVFSIPLDNASINTKANVDLY